MGYIYMITNTQNQKKYIGLSIHEPEKKRIKEHLSGRGNRIIANAVKKYGKDVFTYEVLEANVFDEFLPELEIFYIAHYNTVAPNGYNLDSGGFHKIPSEESRRKNSESRKGKLIGKDHPNFGKTMPMEQRIKISESRKGKMTGEDHPNFGKHISIHQRRKISETLKGRKLPLKTRLKISEAHKGEKHHNFGKKASKELLQKFSESHRLPDYEQMHSYFLSLPTDMSLKAKRQLIYNKFPNANKSTIYMRIRKWMPFEGKVPTKKTHRKSPGARNYKKLPDYEQMHSYFISLPPDMPLTVKRQLIYSKFPNVSKDTIYARTRKWVS